MRTTLSIDEAESLGGNYFVEVLSELARQALTQQQPAGTAGKGQSFFGFEPFEQRGPVVSNALVDQLRDEEDA